MLHCLYLIQRNCLLGGGYSLGVFVTLLVYWKEFVPCVFSINISWVVLWVGGLPVLEHIFLSRVLLLCIVDWEAPFASCTIEWDYIVLEHIFPFFSIFAKNLSNHGWHTILKLVDLWKYDSIATLDYSGICMLMTSFPAIYQYFHQL